MLTSSLTIIIATQLALALGVTLVLFWKRDKEIGFKSGREEELLQTLHSGLEQIEWRMEKLEASTSNKMESVLRRN